MTVKVFKFSEIEKQLKASGYWADFIHIEKVIIEISVCPTKKCQKQLEYQSFANAAEHLAFGVCRDCDYAQLFWNESSRFAELKNKFSEKVLRAKGRKKAGSGSLETPSLLSFKK